MKQYQDFLNHILTQGVFKEDRTNTGTISTFGYQMRFDLEKGFPLVTTKKVHFHSVIHELLWFIKGDTNIKYLTDNGVRIWNEWADSEGNLGPVYGKQWRSWATNDGKVIDQLQKVINEIKVNPDSRRLIVSAWNVSDLDKMALPPCHLIFQFYVVNNKLSCMLFQRSADAFLGIPFNIASYSMLTMMIANICNLGYGEFIHSIGDAHIYQNHYSQVTELLKREPKELPKLIIKKRDSIDSFTYEDFTLESYNYHPAIKGTVAV